MDIIDLIIYILPAWVANGSAVIFGGGKPMDFGKKWRGKRILGDGKTWRGFFGGIMMGTIVGFALIPFGHSIPIAFLLSLGAMIGDAFGSFIKRRIGIPRGQPLPIADQTLFLIFAILLAYPFKPLSSIDIIFLILITIPLHLSTNIIAYKLNLKRVPW